MKSWDDYVFIALMSFVIIVVLSLIGVAVHHEINYPILSTVRHGENVHHRASINIRTNTGIIEGTDSEGRRFIYRDGWEAIQEESR